MREIIKKTLAWFSVLAVMAYIGYSLGEGYFPENVIPDKGPVYTNSAYEELERENAEYKLKWKTADTVIMDILRTVKTR